MSKPMVPDATVYLVGQLVLESQRLEEALKYLLLIWEVLHGEIPDEAEAQRRVEDRTFASKLLTQARGENLISEHVRSICAKALEERNRVVHRLIRERGTDLLTPYGRGRVSKDVAAVLQLVIDATGEIAVPLVALGRGVGLPTSDWEARTPETPSSTQQRLS